MEYQSCRVTSPTKYAVSQGVWVAKEGEWYDGNSPYWLRTAGSFMNYAACVGNDITMESVQYGL